MKEFKDTNFSNDLYVYTDKDSVTFEIFEFESTLNSEDVKELIKFLNVCLENKDN
jgi:hypothetical protein